jgi:hypothetical protein
MDPELKFISVDPVAVQPNDGTILIIEDTDDSPPKWGPSAKSRTRSRLQSLTGARAMAGEGRVLNDSPELIVDSPEGWEFLRKNPGIAPRVRP